ncbi:ribbon-helix-helix protein, CopG family [Candidatus Bathyarchaeota archaeon]|nr:ribbon-helix-helix protein, CopG family [Candidatus Bathyarchaeota archaeon]
MSRVIPVRIPKDVLEKVELLVGMGRYANRSEALRAMIVEHLEEMKGLLAYGEANLEARKLQKIAASMKEGEFLTLCQAIFKGSETSVELIEEQRGE